MIKYKGKDYELDSSYKETYSKISELRDNLLNLDKDEDLKEYSRLSILLCRAIDDFREFYLNRSDDGDACVYELNNGALVDIEGLKNIVNAISRHSDMLREICK